ncbi:MAG: hypothetical protein GX638_05360, partial [Crenarchaeota archaeon]|nr:hypothetical protein [Thermoproteota archaeon]
MPKNKAVITDYIGTLTNVRNYDMDKSIDTLYHALDSVGFKIEKLIFLSAYKKAHEKYRAVRYGH